MIRIRDISLPPQQDMSQLVFAAARQLRIDHTQIKRLDASGGVTVRSPSETARGSVAIYDLDRRLITMLGNVSLVQGGNTVNGGRLVIDLNSGRSTIDGKGVAGTGQGGRVTGRFTVRDSGTN